MKKITLKLAKDYKELVEKYQDTDLAKQIKSVAEKITAKIPEGKTINDLKEGDIDIEDIKGLTKEAEKLNKLSKERHSETIQLEFDTYALYTGKKVDDNTDLEEVSRTVDKFRKIIQRYSGTN